MSTRGRYERRTAREERAGIVAWEGLDTVTGLPVLLYEVRREPAAGLDALESEHIPAILDARFDGDRGEIVAAFSSGYQPVTPDRVDDEIVRAAARAMVDAERAGVPHGDLRPERFLVADDHLLVEGYGVPWRPEHDPPSFGDDVRAFGSAFLELGRGRLSANVLDVLAMAASPDPHDRPRPTTLIAMLDRNAETALPPHPERDRDPLVIVSDAGEPLLEITETPPQVRRAPAGSFSKAPPPGTQYRAGREASEMQPGRFKFPSLHDGVANLGGPRRTYRFAVLVAILMLTAVLAFLALSRRGDELGNPTANQTVVYVVDVAVEPAGLPPVRLFVVDGPDASKWQPGTELGNVPGRIVLDREGTWQFQARFQERLSQVASLELPATRSVTLTFSPTPRPQAP